MVPAARAGEETMGDYFSNMGKQLGYGLLNVVSSPAEIPCTMVSEIKAKGGGTGTFTGFGKGLYYMVRRIVIGVADVGTFMIPRSEPSLPYVCQEPKAA